MNWTYNGAWTVFSGMTGPTGGNLHRGDAVDATAAFTFTGKQFKLKYTQNTNRGTMGVYVDGNLITTLNEYGAFEWQKVYISPAFTAGTHTVEFKHTGGGAYVDVDSIEILPDTPPGVNEYDDDNGNWTYNGAWTVFSGLTGPMGGNLHRGDAEGAWATFTFSGTQFKLKYTQNTNRGNMGIYVDGELLTTLNENGAFEWQKVYSSPVFASGTHTVEFRHAGGGAYVDVDSFEVLATVPPGVNTYDDGDVSWTYSGAWTTFTGLSGPTGGTLHRGDAAGASASFSFSGTQFILKYTQNTNRGSVGIYVDGKLVTMLNENGAFEWGKAYTSPVFASGGHRVEFRHMGDGTYIDVDQIQVLATVPPGTNVYDDNHANWNYVGTWTSFTGMTGPTGGNLHRGDVVNASASFAFSGTQFILKYTQNTNRAIMAVYVDGVLVTTLNENGAFEWQKVYTSPVFSSGTHLVRFEHAGGGTYVDVDQIQIP